MLCRFTPTVGSNPTVTATVEAPRSLVNTGIAGLSSWSESRPWQRNGNILASSCSFESVCTGPIEDAAESWQRRSLSVATALVAAQSVAPLVSSTPARALLAAVCRRSWGEIAGKVGSSLRARFTAAANHPSWEDGRRTVVSAPVRAGHAITDDHREAGRRREV